MSKTAKRVRAENFVHLHLHTEHSLLDSTIQIDKLGPFLAARGFRSCAITDHGSLSGVWRFVQAMGKHGIKPILGVEFYWVPDRFQRPKREKRFHVVALAKNRAGWLKISRAMELAWSQGFHRVPRIDQDLLLNLAPDCVILTACLSGPLPSSLISEDEEGEAVPGYSWAEQCFRVFGRDFYVEIQPNDMDLQMAVNVELVQVAKELGIELVATNDSHYLEPEGWETHDTLLAIRESHRGKTVLVSDPNRWRYNTRRLNVATRAEMEEAFRRLHPGIDPQDWTRALDNTVEIAERLDWGILKKRTKVLPNVHVTPGFDSAHDELEAIVWGEGWTNRAIDKKTRGKTGVIDWLEEVEPEEKPLAEVYAARVQWELEQIRAQGFSVYFMLVMDLVVWAKSKGIRVGPGRGSVAGSLVAYLLGITAVDSIKYGCPFSRFIAPGRVDFPDIDLDFPAEERDTIRAYLADRYGQDQMGLIANFDTAQARGVLRDVARVWGVPISRVNAAAKEIVDGIDPENPTIRTFIEDYPDVAKHCAALEGQLRHLGAHAAGIVVSDSPLRLLSPLRVNRQGETMASWDKRDLEAVGLLKLDVLGLDVFSYIQRTLRMVQERRGEDLEPEDLEPDDPAVFEAFREGHTELVWQFNSQTAIGLLKELEPDRFSHLVAASALLRPGPLRSGIADTYLQRRKGGKTKSLDRRMDQLLGETYGVAVFQEDVMALARGLGGFTWGEADGMRKAIGKKIPEDLAKYRQKFVDGCQAGGMKPKTSEVIWAQIEEFGGYAFNRAHSTAYSMLSYWTMYLKIHYPLEFLTAALQVEREHGKRISYIQEARRLGLRIFLPDVQESDLSAETEGDQAIRLGLSGIKGLRQQEAESICENSPYKDFGDFLERSGAKPGSIKLLLTIGALDCLCSAPKWTLENLPQAIKDAKKGARLFDKIPPEGGEFSEEERVQAQLILAACPPEAGGYQSAVDQLQEVAGIELSNLTAVGELDPGWCGLACAFLTDVDRTKTGRLKLTAEDPSGRAVVICESKKVVPEGEPAVGRPYLILGSRLTDELRVSSRMWDLGLVREGGKGTEEIRAYLGLDGTPVVSSLSTLEEDGRSFVTLKVLVLAFDTVVTKSGKNMGILVVGGGNGKIREILIWSDGLQYYPRHWEPGNILRLPLRISTYQGKKSWSLNMRKSSSLQILNPKS